MSMRFCETPQVYRELRMLATFSAPLRTAVFEQKEHLVIPVVALMEGVVFASGASSPEFVPAEVLAVMPGSWNGRAVCWDHPVVDGAMVSANDPRVLEKYNIGPVFNTRMDGKKLLMEAWVELARAEKSEEGREVVRRARAQEPIEVSVGVYTIVHAEEGTYNGKQYFGRWAQIAPDHLAMLPEGKIGACSNDMGCGAPRRAQAVYQPGAENLEVVYEPETKLRAAEENTMVKCAKCGHEHEGRCATRARLLALPSHIFFRGAAKDEEKQGTISVADIRQSLELALNAVVPGFMGIGEDGMFLEEGIVVYAAAPDPAVWQLFQRSFKVKDDGTVNLGDDTVEVRPVTRFEPLTETTTQPKPPCGCGGRQAENASSAAAQQEGAQMKTIKERATALIEAKNNPFTEADRAFLEGVSEARMTELEGFKPETAVTPPATTPETEEAFLARNPGIAKIVSEHKANEHTKRVNLVGRLKTAQSVYTEAELDGMEIAQLEKLAAVAKVNIVPATTDYSAATGAQQRSAEESENAPAVSSMGARFAAQKK